jgi:hypothetical protein
MFSFLRGQEYFSKIVTDTIPINLENSYKISEINIIPFTETIRLRGEILKQEDYFFSYSTASFKLSDSLAYSIFDTLIVSYQSINFGLKKEYKKRILIVKYDEFLGDTVKFVQSEGSLLTAESIFGSSIERSGTLVRGFSIGTNKDLTLTSGLRLQLSGKLSDDLEIVAALTDENTPIQPEGTTERLEELDKVFIQVKHPAAEGTFGDFQFQQKAGEFGFVDRKLQGLMGQFHYGSSSAYFALASSKGKFNTNNFNGLDGVQGPYRLSGINNERDIIIIAGTEKVYIDGIPMKRGEANDYVIEYSNAQITFTPNRLITSVSRITVDFEYTDRRYTRNFFTAGTQSKFWDEKIGLKFHYVREGDDPDAPIDISLSEEDKNILRTAGDNRNSAVKSGVRIAEPDSLGNVRGVYRQIDSVFNEQQYIIYVYDPGNPEAIYNVSFSYVGERNGDYVRESIGNFRFVGIGNGSYLPVIFLPLPELKQSAGVVVDVKPLQDLTLSLEYAGSLWDKNRFSNLDEGDNYGYARNLVLNFQPANVKIGEVNLGRIGLTYKDRYIQSRFTSPDRFNEIEFNRNYNLDLSSQRESETLREIGLLINPIKELRINSSAGFLRKGSSFKSDRFNNYLTLTDINSFGLDYNLDYVKSDNNLIRSSWFRHKANAFYKWWKLKPSLDFLAENRTDRFTSQDSVLSGSLKYYEITPSLQLAELEGITFTARYSFREDYMPGEGELIKESYSFLQGYELSYREIREVSSSLSLNVRNKRYKEYFKLKGFLDNETILVRSQSRFLFFQAISGDLFYEVATQRTAKLEKVFVRVERGTGNFRYLGDLNYNGIADEFEFEPTLYDGDFIVVTVPTDELFPVIELKTSTKWRIEFDKLIGGNSFISKIFKPLSSESFWRIEENSKEEDYKKIYLLNFSSFLNEQKTIRGSNYFQQDFFLFETERDFSLRFRYSQRKSLNQFSGGVEQAFNRERSLRIRFKVVEEIGNQTDLVNETDNVHAPVTSNRRRLISGNNITSDFSYRPERNIEVGFKFKVGRREDNLSINPSTIDLNSQLIRFNFSFAGKGRLRFEAERSELTGVTYDNFIPFELTGGNRLGKNYFWRFNFDYRISSNLQSTVGYDGRIQGGGRTIHSGRAEVRAYF